MSVVSRDIQKVMLAIGLKYPILALTGPRQSGKTTLLKKMFPQYTYLTLEDPDTRQYATDDPKAFLQQYGSKIIFDEVQRVPKLFSYLQSIVDNNPKEMGQFILSGSQNFQLLQNITQSLAGRVAIFKLLPFDFSELKSAKLLPNSIAEICIKGSYPAIYDRKIDSKIFYTNYIQTYIERDVAELLNVHNARQFRAFLGLCATRAGQILNLNSLALECGISQPTAKAWLSILESSYIVFLLQPYYENFGKRIIKSPKLYFYDTGLLCRLLNINDVKKFDTNSIKGSIFENLIVSECFKKNYHQYTQYEYWYWRDSAGNEVDLLKQNDDGFDVYEIKSTQTVMPNLFKGLNYFEKLVTDKKISKTLVYGGVENQHRTNYKVVGWKNI